MTKTLTKHLQAIKDSKRGIFVPYIMAGDHATKLSPPSAPHAPSENTGGPPPGAGHSPAHPAAPRPPLEVDRPRILPRNVTF